MRRDESVAALGLLATALIIVCAALPVPRWVEWPLAFGAAVTNILAFVGLLTLISNAASTQAQGWAMGIGGSAMALAFFLSGLLANLLNLLPLAPLLAVGGVVVLAGLLPLCLQLLHAKRPPT